MLGLLLPDVDSHNGGTQGRAPHEYKDIPIFAEYHTSSGSEEEDPIDEQIQQSPINLSPAVQTISAAPHPIATEEAITNMSIAMAITTQVQSSTAPGGAGPLGGGPPGGGGGAPGRGGGAPGGEVETPCNLLSVMENPWVHCPPYLKGITLKLRAFSRSSPPISSLTMMSQLLLHSSKELPLPLPASKDWRSIDGPSNSSSG